MRLIIKSTLLYISRPDILLLMNLIVFQIKKDLLVDFRQKYVVAGIALYVFATIYIAYLAFNKRIMEFELETEDFLIHGRRLLYFRKLYYIFKITSCARNKNSRFYYIGFFKTFLRWCIKKGYSPPMDFVDVHIKKQLADTIALSREEVKLIENAELTGAKDKARDLFLIGIYSGQRFSDYSVFEKADLRNNLIHKVAKKTGAMSFIPLTDKLKSILDKYEWVLPKISSQKFNKRIQKICKKLEINEEIKFTY